MPSAQVVTATYMSRGEVIPNSGYISWLGRSDITRDGHTDRGDGEEAEEAATNRNVHRLPNHDTMRVGLCPEKLGAPDDATFYLCAAQAAAHNAKTM